MMMTEEKIEKPQRIYFSDKLDVNSWSELESILQKLLDTAINSASELILFMEKVSELDAIIDEEMAWRYIKMTRFADNEQYEKEFNDFYAEIVSQMKPYTFKIQKKFYASTHRQELEEPKYLHLNQIISNEIELFRSANIPLDIKLQELANKYGAIYSKLLVEYEGEEKTLSQLGIYLKNQDRTVREEVWKLRMHKMSEVSQQLNDIYDKQIKLNVQKAQNADFDNFRDYMHQAKGRFSYTPAALYKFHAAVEKEVVPFLKEQTELRREKLQLESVRPWDTSVDLDGKILKPFATIEEFIGKAIMTLQDVKPEYGKNLKLMQNSGLLDLENRKGKAPGGYNYPLAETKAPFIFMNAVGLHQDLVTLLHESGHAMHTFLSKEIKISDLTNTPSEVAELASMAMEFLTMDYWTHFYPDSADFRKAKKDQLTGALSFLPWCMIVDAFQHWVYLHPQHSQKERDAYFLSLLARYDTGVDWSGLEDYKPLLWLFQLHIFEVPFYYIEYGMSQLGALAIYMNYKQKGKAPTLQAYEQFLKLGYTRSVKDLYETAGINFDFSEQYLEKLVKFVKNELADLK
ncbi:MAG: M3 family oligoendopeptidase [Candidatus Cloacimonadales bacterium]